MKNILIICLLIFSVSAASAQEQRKARKQKKVERDALLQEQTKKLVAENTWQFEATQMLPMNGKSKILTSPYNVVLKNNEVDSYLPYFGVAYSADYGSTESPMTFTAPIEELNVKDGKKGSYLVKFSAKNKNDLVEFSFNISSTGTTTLSISSTNRQHISYYGNLVPVTEKKE